MRLLLHALFSAFAVAPSRGALHDLTPPPTDWQRLPKDEADRVRLLEDAVVVEWQSQLIPRMIGGVHAPVPWRPKRPPVFDFSALSADEQAKRLRDRKRRKQARRRLRNKRGF